MTNRTRTLWLALPVALLALGILAWIWLSRQPDSDALYGNVDIREVDLAFNAEGRVNAMRDQEGDAVKRGALLATLDASDEQAVRDLAAAKEQQAQAQLDLLLAGSRIEDIDHARAALAAAQASLVHAQASFARQQRLVGRGATPQQALDDARMARDTAQAQRDAAQAQLTELINGPRPQEIEAARAALASAKAQLSLAQSRLDDTRLFAPANGIVMSRVIEPGTVVLPTDTVYSVALTGQVWVRAYAPEPMLGLVAPGTQVTIRTDGTHDLYHGQIGYVSPVAEFTPKTVQTPDLRTQLVYQLRIRVTDPDFGLRQGMPVTILLPRKDR